ncbi:MAG: hypothetical protein LBE76_01705 [Nitrososphaerota archaeon]|jgi:hypothetical protein|nr:hypothetical protein [Nitrososphaerota archaeon]
MEKQLTKIFASLLTLLIAASLIVFPTTVTNQTVTAQEPPLPELIPEPPTGSSIPQFVDPKLTAAAEKKATNIIQNVISVDLTKYTLQLQHSSLSDGTPLTNDNRKITDLTYVLIPLENNGNENSQIIIAFSVEKNVVRNYFITPEDSQIITNPQYANQRAAVRGFLEKYQTYTQIDSSNLIEMLNNADLTKNSITIHGNTKFTVDILSRYGVEHVFLTWVYTVNGADYTKLNIAVNAEGLVTWMTDDRALYTIGDTSINVSMEQAVDIAIANLGSYSYEMPDGSIVKDFNVNKDVALAELFVVPIDFVDYVLRPYWDVTLYLDDVYSGNVFAIKAFIWANNGEIISYSNMATGGISAINNSDGSGSGSFSLSDNGIVVVVAVVVAVAVAVLVIGAVVKKKHR